MAILSGFEYDIFISYRHNDNRSGWVTEFVEHLEEELAATIKEPLSIYFDKNPHDGLLETHNVDRSLEEKLKCLIFIPIISQTYCDPKSFAWEHEFVAFNKLTQEDELGRDIKLSNGNITSRILPIKIHDLDSGDEAVIEKELGGYLRSIEFIYKEPGVNRPLKITDKREDNQNHTNYTNQVNKVANAIKEILSAINNPTITPTTTIKRQPTTNPKSRRKKRGIIGAGLILLLSVVGYFLYPQFQSQSDSSREKSIAVLPFVDMSPDQDQMYLGDGIAEEIINVLTKIQGVNVIGRTSSFSFRNKNKDLISIGNELGVSTILEGSVRKSDNKLRITAQLIDTQTGRHIWSETYDRELDDVFAIQDDISAKIVDKFKLTFSLGTQSYLTKDTKAYLLYLKGKALRNEGITKIEEARANLEDAIKTDSTFVAAYAALSEIYTNMGIYNRGDINELTTLAEKAAIKAIELDPNSFLGYKQLSFINFTFEKDWAATFKNYNAAVEKGMPFPDRYDAYFQACINGKGDEAVNIIQHLLKQDPLSIELLLDLSRMFLYSGRYSEAAENSEKILKISPENSSAQRHAGQAYLFSGKPEVALEYYSHLMKKDSSYTPDGYVGALVALHRETEAREVFASISKPIPSAKKAMAYIHLHEWDSAFKYLDQAPVNDPYLSFLRAEPTFRLAKDDTRYKSLLKKFDFPD